MLYSCAHMAAVGVKGLIENFSEGIAPDPIGSYWGPQTSTLDRCPGASQLLVPMPGSGPSVSVSARDAFGPPPSSRRTSAGQNFFRKCQMVENFGPDLPE